MIARAKWWLLPWSAVSGAAVSASEASITGALRSRSYRTLLLLSLEVRMLGQHLQSRCIAPLHKRENQRVAKAVGGHRNSRFVVTETRA